VTRGELTLLEVSQGWSDRSGYVDDPPWRGRVRRPHQAQRPRMWQPAPSGRQRRPHVSRWTTRMCR